MNDTCKNFCDQQAMNNWSHTSLGIVEIIFTSLNIIINYFVYRKVKVDRETNMFSREQLFKDASLLPVSR